MNIAMAPKKWILLEFDSITYEAAWDLQSKLVAARGENVLVRDVVLFLEHPPVFTLGRRGNKDNVKVAEPFLEKQGIGIVRVERGGDITYHGPGQLVIYPIVDLKESGLDVNDYITRLEEVMIRTAGDFGLRAERDPRNKGAWVRGSKVGSVGIAIRHGITFHGLALNINTSLEPFSWIHPCGLHDVHMTSLHKELRQEVSMKDARRIARKNMESIFGIEFVRMDMKDMNSLLIAP